MIRNLKSLGLVLAAVLVIGAVGASGAIAQTQGKLTTEGGVSVTETASEIGNNSVTFFGAKIECPKSTMTGHKYSETPHVLIPNGSTTGTLTPHFVNCTAADGLGTHRVTVTMKSCDFVVHVLQTSGGVANQYAASMDLVCTTPGDTVDVEFYGFAGSELGGIQCTIKLKQQSDLTGAIITTNTASDDLTITGALTGVHAERSGSGCGTETTTAGEIHINVTVKAKDAVGNSKGITITD